MNKICDYPECNETKNLIEGLVPDDNNAKIFYCKKHWKVMKKEEWIIDE